MNIKKKTCENVGDILNNFICVTNDRPYSNEALKKFVCKHCLFNLLHF